MAEREISNHENNMKNRVLQYDVSRGRIPKIETILNHAELLHHYGLTGIMLYIECVVENSTFPAVGCGNTPITKAYLSKLKNGLNSIGMELIPVFQVLGHQENLLAMPQWKNLGEQAQGRNLNFRLDSTETRRLVKQWLADLVPLFSSQYIHVGCDEIFTLGLGKSGNLIQKNGLEFVLAEYLNEISAHLKSMGKQMMMYADMPIHYPALRDLLDVEIILTNWNYGRLDEAYEQDNHHFARHVDVCAKHENWVVGNCMAEYVLTPFKRLEANTCAWLELGRKSNAHGFIISDWGSNENTNPFILTLLGTIYILQKINIADFSLDDFLAEVSSLVLGKRNHDFERALKFLISAQGEIKYFDDLRISEQMGPFFPSIFLKSPESKSIHRIYGAITRDGLVSFEQDAREAMKLIEKIELDPTAKAYMFRDIHALSRRALAVSLRSLLCYDYVWDSGSAWNTKADMEPRLQMLKEYKVLAGDDLRWYKSVWNEDCLESCYDRCMNLLEKSISDMDGVASFQDNAKNHFVPERIMQQH